MRNKPFKGNYINEKNDNVTRRTYVENLSNLTISAVSPFKILSFLYYILGGVLIILVNLCVDFKRINRTHF